LRSGQYRKHRCCKPTVDETRQVVGWSNCTAEFVECVDFVLKRARKKNMGRKFESVKRVCCEQNMLCTNVNVLNFINKVFVDKDAHDA